MSRHYYLTRSGRLRRKDSTIYFEPAEEKLTESDEKGPDQEGGVLLQDAEEESGAPPVGMDFPDDNMGDLSLNPEATLNHQTTMEAVPMVGSENETASERIKDRRAIPIEDIDALWVFGELDLNSRVLTFLAQHKVPVHFFNYYGFYAGSFCPREYLQAGYVLVRQVRHYTIRRLRLALAREFVQAALHNILRNLRYYHSRGLDLEVEIEGVQAEANRLAPVTNLNDLMGCEGRARSFYYQAFFKILRERMAFSKRVKHPPDNPVNALISFTNGLVYAAVLTQIYRTQLNPTISFLHEPGARRFSLALDLAEVFKPVLADRLIFKLVNNRQLNAQNFAEDLNCCYLKESGRKIILKEWDARLQTTIEHRGLRRKVSYERLIRLECYRLVKHITNVEPYVAFRAWW